MPTVLKSSFASFIALLLLSVFATSSAFAQQESIPVLKALSGPQNDQIVDGLSACIKLNCQGSANGTNGSYIVKQECQEGFSPSDMLLRSEGWAVATSCAPPAGCPSCVYYPEAWWKVFYCPAGYTRVNDRCVRGSNPDPFKNCPDCDQFHNGTNPILTGLGFKVQTEVDIRSTPQGLLGFTRYYNSFNASSVGDSLSNATDFAQQWRHTYSRSLVVSEQTTGSVVAVIRANGQRIFFTLSNGVWMPEADVPLVLTEIISNGVRTGWQVTPTDDSVERYDALGKLQSITTREGFSETVTYDAATGLIKQVVDSFGRSITFAHDSLTQLITSVTAPDGSQISYGYSYADNVSVKLVSATYPSVSGTTTKTYVYGEGANGQPWQLTGIVDENNNRYATWQYDASGRAWLSTHGDLNSTTDRVELTYNGDINTSPSATVTGKRWIAANGSAVLQRTYTFDVIYGVVKLASVDQPCNVCGDQITHTKTYDGAGYNQSMTDFNGNVTNYTYDDVRGLESQRVEAFGSSAQRTVNTTWNASFHLPDQRTVSNVGGNVESMTKWTYNTRGQTTARCQVDPTVSAATSYVCGSSTNAPTGVRQWTYTYCDTAGAACPLVGLLLSLNGPRTDVADVTTYAYYNSTDLSGCATLGGTCHTIGDLQSVTNALGQVTTYVSYDSAGRVTRLKDANGVYTDLTYHPRGWLLTRTVRANANGTPNSTLDATTTFAYDNVGNVTQVTQPDGTFLHYVYDAAHRLTDIYDSANLSNSLQGNHIHYTLDAAGNRTDEVTIGTDNVIMRELSRTYDQLNRLTALINSSNAAVQTYINPVDAPPSGITYTDGYDGNGNAVYSIDGTNNHVGTEQQYDPLNRLVKTLQDHAGTGSTHDTATQYAFDARNNLRSVADPSGLATGYVYDGLNNLTALDSPDTGHAVYTYDAAGNRVTQTDARGLVTSYAYDRLNRLVGVSYATSTLNVTYAYDQANSTTGCDSSYPVGRLTQMTDSSGSTTYCYDQRGNTIATRQTTGDVESDFQYVYTLADRLDSVTYPSGNFVTYSRDSVGRVTGVDYFQVGGTPLNPQYMDWPIVSDITYYPFGPANTITFGTGSTLTKSYDNDYAISSVTSSNPSGLAIEAGVDVLGNLTSASSSPGATPPTRSYAYDPLYRLQSVTSGTSPVESYVYNQTGDRLSKSLNGGSADLYDYGTPQTTHRLLSVGGSSRSYDANGNTISRNGGSMTYDERNRLSLVAGWAYDYNGRGERVLKQTTGALPSDPGVIVGAAFAYSPAGQLLADYSDMTYCRTSRSGCSIAAIWGEKNEYIWADDLLVGVASLDQGSVYYVETDQLGTPRRLMSASDDSIAWSWDYFGSAFGENAPNEDPSNSGNPVAFNLRFPGQYYDSETGLNYNYFRDYEPGTGRYVESDPIGLGGGISTYSYTGDSPFTGSDWDALRRVWVYEYANFYIVDTRRLSDFHIDWPGIEIPCYVNPSLFGCSAYPGAFFRWTAEATENCVMTDVRKNYNFLIDSPVHTVGYDVYHVGFEIEYIYESSDSCPCTLSDYMIEPYSFLGPPNQ